MTEPLPKQNRVEKILASMMAGVLIAAVLSILAIVIFAATGLNDLIGIVVVFPMIGLPTAAVLLIALVTYRMVSAKRR
ncbi:MAG: hypothetical protein ACKOWE_03890 [Micrococcales bacterium]